jgi:hypothetical protein
MDVVAVMVTVVVPALIVVIIVMLAVPVAVIAGHTHGPQRQHRGGAQPHKSLELHVSPPSRRTFEDICAE